MGSLNGGSQVLTALHFFQVYFLRRSLASPGLKLHVFFSMSSDQTYMSTKQKLSFADHLMCSDIFRVASASFWLNCTDRVEWIADMYSLSLFELDGVSSTSGEEGVEASSGRGHSALFHCET